MKKIFTIFLIALGVTSYVNAKKLMDMTPLPYQAPKTNISPVINNGLDEAPNKINYVEAPNYKTVFVGNDALFTYYNEGSHLQYDPVSKQTILIKNPRKGTTNLTGGILSFVTSTDGGVSWGADKKIFDSTNRYQGFPSFAIMNPGTETDPKNMQYIVSTWNYAPAGQNWTRTGTQIVVNTSGGSYVLEVSNPDNNNPGNAYNWQSNTMNWMGFKSGASNYALAYTKCFRDANASTPEDLVRMGLLGWDFTGEDYLVSTLPPEWESSQFGSPTQGQHQSGYFSDLELGADPSGKIFAVGSFFMADEPDKRVPAFSFSTNNGKTWSPFTGNSMPSQLLTDYAANNIIQDPGDNVTIGMGGTMAYQKFALVVTGNNKFSYFVRYYISNATKSAGSFQLIEVRYDNGSWSMNKVAELNDIPYVCQVNPSSASGYTGSYPLKPRLSVNNKGNELEAALTADGKNIIIKWIDYNSNLINTFPTVDGCSSDQFGQASSEQALTIDSLYSTDVFAAYRSTTNNEWTNEVVNLTKDLTYNKVTKMAPIVNSINDIAIVQLDFDAAANITDVRKDLPTVMKQMLCDNATRQVVKSFKADLINSVKDNAPEVNDFFTLNGINPNPVQDEVEFNFSSKVSGNATLEIFNSVGDKIATVYNSNIYANGSIQTSFDTRELSNGVYFYTLTINGVSATKTFTVIK